MLIDKIALIERMLNGFVQDRRLLLDGANENLKNQINTELETADLFKSMIGVAKRCP